MALIQPPRGVRLSTAPYRETSKPLPQVKQYISESSTCNIHGITEFRSVKDYRKDRNGKYRGGFDVPQLIFRCNKCLCLKKERSRKKCIREVAQNKKKILVEKAGGSCRICDYDKCFKAMHFHHIDPSTKNFEIAYGLRRYSIAKLLEETAKCVLFCNRCHVEVEEGLVSTWL